MLPPSSPYVLVGGTYYECSYSMCPPWIPGRQLTVEISATFGSREEVLRVATTTLCSRVHSVLPNSGAMPRVWINAVWVGIEDIRYYRPRAVPALNIDSLSMTMLSLQGQHDSDTRPRHWL